MTATNWRDNPDEFDQEAIDYWQKFVGEVYRFSHDLTKKWPFNHPDLKRLPRYNTVAMSTHMRAIMELLDRQDCSRDCSNWYDAWIDLDPEESRSPGSKGP